MQLNSSVAPRMYVSLYMRHYVMYHTTVSKEHSIMQSKRKAPDGAFLFSMRMRHDLLIVQIHNIKYHRNSIFNVYI